MIFQFMMITPGLCKKVSMVYTISIIIITTPRHIDKDKDARARPIHSLQQYSIECWDQFHCSKLSLKKKNSAETSERPLPLKVKQSSNSVVRPLSLDISQSTLYTHPERKKTLHFQLCTKFWHTYNIHSICCVYCCASLFLPWALTEGWLPLELIKTTNVIAATTPVHTVMNSFRNMPT